MSKTTKTMMVGAISGVVYVGLYLAFTCDADPREWIAAAITAGLSISATLVFATAADIRFHLRLRDLAQAWRIPGQVFSGTGQVFRGLAKELLKPGGAGSSLRAAHFDHGKENNLADAGRRALATIFVTATPNSIVLGFDEKQKLMVYHQILPSRLPKLARSLGARP